MNSMLSHWAAGLRLLLVTLLTCSAGYPIIIWLIAQAIVPESANGSLLTSADGTVIGSRVIAQRFTRMDYFWPRPSAVNYDASHAGGSNLSPLNPALKDRVTAFQSRIGNDARPIPPDLVTASGSGLDPHITLAAALYQVDRVARARRMDSPALSRLVESAAFRPGGPFTPEPIVNVLELNLMLDGKVQAKP